MAVFSGRLWSWAADAVCWLPDTTQWKQKIYSLWGLWCVTLIGTLNGHTHLSRSISYTPLGRHGTLSFSPTCLIPTPSPASLMPPVIKGNLFHAVYCIYCSKLLGNCIYYVSCAINLAFLVLCFQAPFLHRDWQLYSKILMLYLKANTYLSIAAKN